MRRIGILGSLVWDEIHGRDPAAPPVEEWGGIAYALASLDAHVADDWEIVPLIKVGRDLAPRARQFLGSLSHLAPGARGIEVPVPTNRVVLRYESTERRCERMSGGVPGWTWSELGPMVRDLDALYLNFISGFEMCLGTAQALRHGFAGPIFTDLHSLFLGMREDGIRTLQPLSNAAEWLGCFDVVQCNEEELAQLGHDSMAVAATAMAAGVSALIVTLGPRGAVYFCEEGVDASAFAPVGATRASPQRALASRPRALAPSRPLKTALVPAPSVEVLDPTGCGDVFGAALAARLVAGSPLVGAIEAANAAAARSAGFRGATGLARHLRGELLAL